MHIALGYGSELGHVTMCSCRWGWGKQPSFGMIMCLTAGERIVDVGKLIAGLCLGQNTGSRWW